MDTRPLIEQRAEQYPGDPFIKRALQFAGGAAIVAVGLAIEAAPYVLPFTRFGRALGAGEGVSSDHSPSSAIASASWQPNVITVTFVGGRSYSYPCDPATWLAYKAASSKGRFVNEVFVT